MGFLDKKTRVIDFCLTERGRDLLAENQLRIVHYAFSDELIDYSGSLSEYITNSGSYDDIVYKNYVPIEASTLGRTGLPRDLTSFLYTCPEQRSFLPPFVLSTSSSLSLQRLYSDVPYGRFVSRYMQAGVANPDTVMVTERDDTLPTDRQDQYAAEQDLQRLAQEDPYFINLVKS